MEKSVAIVGAGVSGLTCAVVFAERGYRAAIFAAETGQRTTSAAAAAIWYPYDAEPAAAVIAWALETYKVLVDLSRDSQTGVSMLELRSFSRTGEIPIPDWAIPLGASVIPSGVEEWSGLANRDIDRQAARPRERERTSQSLTVFPPAFTSGFALKVPLMDTTIYLDYLKNRFVEAGGKVADGVRFEKLEDIDREFALVINCSGIGAKTLASDVDLEPHRGQVAIVPKIDISCAIVCDDGPLMYAIPRSNDCVFGGTNEVSSNCDVDPTSTSRIVAECSRVLNLDKPRVLAERVGLRPFRRSGVCVEGDRLRDGRTVIHNYGHGGSGFTLSWGCAREVFKLARGCHPDRREGSHARTLG
jgi:D-amino-acid oxidase